MSVKAPLSPALSASEGNRERSTWAQRVSSVRRVEPELLDHLTPDDPRAIDSRKDLERINAWMRNHKIMAEEIRRIFGDRAPKRILEIGAGDGRFLLRVCAALPEQWRGATVCLLDRQAAVSSQTVREFETLGWCCEMVQAEVQSWMRERPPGEFDLMIANLFLHHFREAELRELLQGVRRSARALIAVEPRRWGWALLFSRATGLIGCNSVTRHDAVVSVRAGFAGQELSRLWPSEAGWLLEERPANWYSHLFVARRDE